VGLVLLVAFDDFEREVFIVVPGSCCPNMICRCLAGGVALGAEVGLLTEPDAAHAVAILRNGRENLDVELLVRRFLASFAERCAGLGRASGEPYSHIATCAGVTSTSSSYTKVSVD
jgi:hypothetical protein